MGQPRAPTPSSDEPLWWYAAFDGVRIPWAVTGDAVRYYVGLSEDIAAGRSPLSVSMKSTRLVYTAEVTRPEVFERDGKRFEGAAVVRLGLSWQQYCGDLCAMRFQAERWVVFDPAGAVLAVFGDGPTSYLVS